MHYHFSQQLAHHCAKLREGDKRKSKIGDLALHKLNKVVGEPRLTSMKLSLIVLLMQSENSLSREITT